VFTDLIHENHSNILRIAEINPSLKSVFLVPL